MVTRILDPSGSGLYLTPQELADLEAARARARSGQPAPSSPSPSSPSSSSGRSSSSRRVTASDVARLFEQYNVPVTFYGINSQNPGESEQERLERIAREISSGQRTEADLRYWLGRLSSEFMSDPSLREEELNRQLEELYNELFRQQQRFGQSFSEGPRAIDEVRRLFPWAEELGLLDTISEEIKRESSVEAIIAVVRESAAYKARFPAIEGPDGTRRMTEAEYLRTVEDFRDVLREFGFYNEAEDTPVHYAVFFEQNIDPNELRDRLEVYRDLEAGSDDLKDAFFVYAGLDVTTDDLYRATVDPVYATQLVQAYDQAVAGGAFDYERFITRATERGLQRAADLLREYQKQGLIAGQVVSKLLAVEPDFAREVMGALYTQGAQSGRLLNLSELLTTFDLAMLASAATESGLEMPTRERAQELLDAGVNRAQALRAYGSFAGQREFLRGAAQRANVLNDIGQSLFEEAVLLGRGEATRELSRAIGTEEALGRAGGGFATSLQGGRVAQTGRQRF